MRVLRTEIRFYILATLIAIISEEQVTRGAGQTAFAFIFNKIITMSLQTTILIVDYNRVALNCILQQYNCEMDAMKSKDGSDARSSAGQ